MPLTGVLTTNGAGDAPFVFLVTTTVGQGVTMTATDPAGNTSEFSACATVHSTLEPPPAASTMAGSGSWLEAPASIRGEGIGRIGRGARLQK